MDSPNMKMGSEKELTSPWSISLAPGSIFLGNVIFDKYSSNLLSPFGKGDPAISPDKSFLVHQ